MLNKKSLIFLIASLIIILLILLILKSRSSKTTAPVPVLMSSPSTSTTQPQTPYISFNESKRDQLVDIMKTRPKIVDSDQTIRTRLISQLGNKSGVITRTNNYIIKYVKAPNIFQVEILTNDYLTAKQQATQWFKNQGLSDDGICKLPIQFYLSAQVKDALQDNIENFNYLPEGC